jgi:hypothetical protein
MTETKLQLPNTEEETVSFQLYEITIKSREIIYKAVSIISGTRAAIYTAVLVA